MLQLFRPTLALLLVAVAGCQTTNTKIVSECRSFCVHARVGDVSDNADDNTFSMGTIHLQIKETPVGQVTMLMVRQGSDLNGDGILQDNEIDPSNLINSYTPGSEVIVGAITNQSLPPGPKLKMIRVIEILGEEDEVLFSVSQVAT